MRELSSELDAPRVSQPPRQDRVVTVPTEVPMNDNHPAAINRLGTAHRLETLRSTGILDKHYGTVVDIGGYDGAICSRISADEHIVVEPFPPAVSLRATGVRFFTANGAATALPAGSADLVLLMDVLEHVEEPAELVREAVRLLKPGGVGVITVPSSKIRIFPWFLQNWADRRWDHTLRRGYRPQHILPLLEYNGAEASRTLDMGCAGFRMLYLPLSIGWRIWRGAAKVALSAISRVDYRFRSVGAGRGYVFIEFRRSA